MFWRWSFGCMSLNSQFGSWNDFVFLCHWLFENWMYVPNSVTDFRQTWPLCIKWFSAFSFIHCKIKALIWAFVHHCVPHCLYYIVCYGDESMLQSDFFSDNTQFYYCDCCAITVELENISLPILFNVHCSSIWSNIISKNSIPRQITEKSTVHTRNNWQGKEL